MAKFEANGGLSGSRSALGGRGGRGRGGRGHGGRGRGAAGVVPVAGGPPRTLE